MNVLKYFFKSNLLADSQSRVKCSKLYINYINVPYKKKPRTCIWTIWIKSTIIRTPLAFRNNLFAYTYAE